MVYFIRHKLNKSPIKIGYTHDARRLRGRMDSIATGSAWGIELLATCEGGYALERKLHYIFREMRMEREWFQDSTALRSLAAWVKNNPSATPDAILTKAATFAERYEPRSGPRGTGPRGGTRRTRRRRSVKAQLDDGSLTIRKIDD